MLGVCVVAFTKNKSSGKYTNRGNISHFAADQTQSLKVNKQMKFHYEAEKQLQVFLCCCRIFAVLRSKAVPPSTFYSLSQSDSFRNSFPLYLPSTVFIPQLSRIFFSSSCFQLLPFSTSKIS